MCPIGPCIRDLYTKIRSHINSEIFVLSTTCIYPRSSTTNQIVQFFQSRILFPPRILNTDMFIRLILDEIAAMIQNFSKTGTLLF